MAICIECEIEFDPHSKAKRMVGGLKSHCVDCSSETTVRYAGVQNSDGKQAGVSIMRFKSEADRAAYIDFWQVNSGLHKGKSCQIGHGLKSTPGFAYQTVAVFEGNTNHKGKA
jgi:hypothetical protein